MIRQVMIFLFLIILSSCGGLSDMTDSLGGGYLYIGEGGGYNQIVFRQKSKNMQSPGNDETVIYPNVTQYLHNDQFIIIHQEPSYDANISTIMFERGFGVFFNETERKNNEAKADSILRNDPFFIEMFQESENYYVIDKPKRKTYGPFTFAEFATVKDSLNTALEFDK